MRLDSMMSARRRRIRGFTLIEVMIAVAIIGVLSSVALPGFSTFQLRSKSAEVRANLSAIRVSLS